MEPTIRSHGDIILVNKMARRFRRGDITVCVSPQDAGKLICKRIVATEYDELVIEDDTDKLYGLGRSRSYVRVPRGHVWVEGDNRERSHDSRHFGAIPLGLVQGRAICKVCVCFLFIIVSTCVIGVDLAIT